MDKALKLHIFLNGSQPKIWRDILVPSDITFYKLHHILQIAMGWENSHLYEFSMDAYRIGQQFEDLELLGPEEIIDSRTIKTCEILEKEGQKLTYLYDFGDYWEHSVSLTRIIDDLRIPFPICCDGQLNCPPEDVGGLPGFYEFLDIMGKPKHPERKEYKEWVKSKLVAIDGQYDPEKFHMERTNLVLSQLDTYIQEWEDECNQE